MDVQDSVTTSSILCVREHVEALLKGRLDLVLLLQPAARLLRLVSGQKLS